jgi:hypothetical protein
MKSLKSKFVLLVFCMALLIPSVVSAAEMGPVEGKIEPSEVVFRVKSTDMTVNGQVTVMDALVAQKDGFTYIPMRYAFEGIGAELTWNSEERSARLKWDNNKTAMISIDSDKYMGTDGGEKVASATSIILGDRAMIPVSLFAQVTGWTLDLADEGKTIRFIKP